MERICSRPSDSVRLSGFVGTSPVASCCGSGFGRLFPGSVARPAVRRRQLLRHRSIAGNRALVRRLDLLRCDPYDVLVRATGRGKGGALFCGGGADVAAALRDRRLGASAHRCRRAVSRMGMVGRSGRRSRPHRDDDAMVAGSGLCPGWLLALVRRNVDGPIATGRMDRRRPRNGAKPGT